MTKDPAHINNTIFVQYNRPSDPSNSKSQTLDQVRYVQAFQKLKELVQNRYPSLKVVGNRVPISYMPYKISQDKYIDTDTNKYVIFPQTGAFEVIFRGEIIFSKKQSQIWPNVATICERIANIHENNNKSHVLQQKQYKQPQNSRLENNSASQQNSSGHIENHKKFISTNHFKHHKSNEKHNEADTLTEKYLSVSSTKQLSDFTREQSRQNKKRNEASKNLIDLNGQTKLKEMLKNRNLISKEQGKKQMIIKLDSIEEENNSFQDGLVLFNKNKSKPKKQNKLREFENQINCLENRFKKFETKVQDITSKNVFNENERNSHAQQSCKLKKYMDVVKQEQSQYSSKDRSKDQIVIGQKCSKLQAYVHGSQQQKHEKLHKIYGQWKFLQKNEKKNKKMLKNRQLKRLLYPSQDQQSEDKSKSPYSLGPIISFKSRQPKGLENQIERGFSHDKQLNSFEHQSGDSSDIRVKTVQNFYKSNKKAAFSKTRTEKFSGLNAQNKFNHKGSINSDNHFQVQQLQFKHSNYLNKNIKENIYLKNKTNHLRYNNNMQFMQRTPNIDNIILTKLKKGQFQPIQQHQTPPDDYLIDFNHESKQKTKFMKKNLFINKNSPLNKENKRNKIINSQQGLDIYDNNSNSKRLSNFTHEQQVSNFKNQLRSGTAPIQQFRQIKNNKIHNDSTPKKLYKNKESHRELTMNQLQQPNLNNQLRQTIIQNNKMQKHNGNKLIKKSSEVKNKSLELKQKTNKRQAEEASYFKRKAQKSKDIKEKSQTESNTLRQNYDSNEEKSEDLIHDDQEPISQQQQQEQLACEEEQQKLSPAKKPSYSKNQMNVRNGKVIKQIKTKVASKVNKSVNREKQTASVNVSPSRPNSKDLNSQNKKNNISTPRRVIEEKKAKKHQEKMSVLSSNNYSTKKQDRRQMNLSNSSACQENMSNFSQSENHNNKQGLKNENQIKKSQRKQLSVENPPALSRKNQKIYNYQEKKQLKNVQNQKKNILVRQTLNEKFKDCQSPRSLRKTSRLVTQKQSSKQKIQDDSSQPQRLNNENSQAYYSEQQNVELNRQAIENNSFSSTIKKRNSQAKQKKASKQLSNSRFQSQQREKKKQQLCSSTQNNLEQQGQNNKKVKNSESENKLDQNEINKKQQIHQQERLSDEQLWHDKLQSSINNKQTISEKRSHKLEQNEQIIHESKRSSSHNQAEDSEEDNQDNNPDSPDRPEDQLRQMQPCKQYNLYGQQEIYLNFAQLYLKGLYKIIQAQFNIQGSPVSLEESNHALFQQLTIKQSASMSQIIEKKINLATNKWYKSNQQLKNHRQLSSFMKQSRLDNEINAWLLEMQSQITFSFYPGDKKSPNNEHIIFEQNSLQETTYVDKSMIKSKLPEECIQIEKDHTDQNQQIKQKQQIFHRQPQNIVVQNQICNNKVLNSSNTKQTPIKQALHPNKVGYESKPFQKYREIGIQKQLTLDISVQTQNLQEQLFNTTEYNNQLIGINKLQKAKSNHTSKTSNFDSNQQIFQKRHERTSQNMRGTIVSNSSYKRQFIRAEIINKIFSQNINQQLHRYQQSLQNPVSHQKSENELSVRQIYKSGRLFNEKGLQIELIDSKIPAFIKVLNILSEKSQWIITRIFQDAYQAMQSTIFGVWICCHYEWKCIIVDQNIQVHEIKPKYTHHQGNQYWANILEKALAKAMGGYQNLMKAQTSIIFNFITGCNSISAKIKEDPTKNNKLLQLVHDCHRKNYIIHAQKIETKFKNSKDKEYVFYINSLKKGNSQEETLIQLSQDNRQSFWMKLSKFSQQFSKIQILQLRINYNFAHVELGVSRPGQLKVVELTFSQDGQGCITLSYLNQLGLLKAFLYKQQKSKILKLVGEAKEKSKQSLFFECCFNEGKYYVFIESQQKPLRLSYFGQDKPLIKITEQIKGQGLCNDVAEYMPVKYDDQRYRRQDADFDNKKSTKGSRIKDNYIGSKLKDTFIEYVVNRTKKGFQ